MSVRPLVLVTRPEPQASRWTAQLQQLLPGAEIRPLPLIVTAPVHAPGYQQQLQQAWSRLPELVAAYFVSVPAVTGFFAAVPDALVRWQASGIRAWAPGRGTRDALLQAGVPAAGIDSPPADAAQFDSETLWPLIQPQIAQALQQGKRILRVRGTDQLLPGQQADQGAGRDWMGQQLQAAGVGVDTVVAYQRQPPDWSAAFTAALLRELQGRRCIWLWSSSQALEHAVTLLPAHDWSGDVAVATHPRIAENARRHGFVRLQQARPVLADVAQSIQSLL